MAIAVRVLDGPAAGRYASVARLYRSSSPPRSVTWDVFRTRLTRLTRVAALSQRPASDPEAMLVLTGAELARIHDRARLDTGWSSIHVLDGPLAGRYRNPTLLHQALGEGAIPKLALFGARIRDRRRTARIPPHDPINLTTADLAALCKPSTQAPFTVASKSLTVLSACLLVPRGLRANLMRLAHRGQRSFPTVEAMIEACSQEFVRLSPEVDVLDGPYSGRYRSITALASRVADESPTSFSGLRHRLGAHRKDQSLTTPHLLDLTGAQLDSLVAASRSPHGGACAVSVRVADGNHAGTYSSLRALFDQAHTDTSLWCEQFLNRVKTLRRSSGRAEQRPLELTGAELTDCLARRYPSDAERPAAMTARRAYRNSIAIRVSDGPYAGDYPSVAALAAATRALREVSKNSLLKRIRSYGLRRDGSLSAPLEISHADLGPLLLRHYFEGGRKGPMRPMRVTSGPHAGEYPSINALYRALGPTPPLASASFGYRVQAWRAAERIAPGELAELTADVLASLLEPQFLSDASLRSACAAALPGNPDITVAALRLDLERSLGKAVSVDRIKLMLDEVRRSSAPGGLG